MSATRPTYQAILDAALAQTEATSGWLLADETQGLRVVATAGQAGSGYALGSHVEPIGAKAYALASGQPTALLPQAGDVANHNAGGAPGIPPSLLAVPCGDDEVVGVLEVSGKVGSRAFTFDDIQALSGLASVATAALLEQSDVEVAVASPAQLGAELGSLAERNPSRYASLAQVIEVLLGTEA